jgi:hypothetical protein
MRQRLLLQLLTTRLPRAATDTLGGMCSCANGGRQAPTGWRQGGPATTTAPAGGCGEAGQTGKHHELASAGNIKLMRVQLRPTSQ